VIVRKKAHLVGILLIISGIGGLICIFLFYLLPAILLIISGVMGLARRDKTTTTAA